MEPTMPPAVPRPSPGIAAFLSFVWPGLGEAYAGHRTLALVFALPVLVLATLVAWQALGGLDVLALRLLDRTVAAAVLGIVVALGFWRVASVLSAWRLAGHGRRAAAEARALVVVLIVAVLGMHGLAGWYAFAFYDAASRIFVADTPSATPGVLGTPSPGASDNGGDFGASPDPGDLASASRVTFLVTGVDSGHGREHALTDTLLVVSVDHVANTAVMISLPRDVSNVPLYSGGTYNDKINSLMTYARQHPQQFPDGPIGTLTREIGYLLGTPVKYFAAIDLEGFQQMVDLVGGVDIDNPRQISDATYDWFDGTYGFHLSPGPHHLNGRTALAYARSRKGVGDDDFTRAARQQQLLVALRQKLTQPSMLLRLPALLDAAAKVIRTNVPADQVADFLGWAKLIPSTSIQRYVLEPPYATHPPTSSTGGIYTLVLDMARIRALSIQLFGTDSAYSP
jgi:LCP family protein required for cell wall assembly